MRAGGALLRAGRAYPWLAPAIALVGFVLAAGVWTADIGRAIRFVGELDAGTVWVNSYLEQSTSAPFGGSKDSGFGREMRSLGPLEFSEVKTAYVRGIRGPS